jgi:hypothetical protein
MLILGGGGYTIRNVSRAWAYETGVIVGQEIGPGLKFLYLFNFCSMFKILISRLFYLWLLTIKRITIE